MPEPRRLVTLRRIIKVVRLKSRHRPYDVVTVGGGWQVVVYHADFAVGDLVVYFEIDSFIPATGGRFAWDHGDKMSELGGEKGYHVRSQVLGTQISQGLVQHVGAVPAIRALLDRLAAEHHHHHHADAAGEDEDEDEDEACRHAQQMQLDDVVGVRKWEVPFEAHGKILGRVPTFFPRPAWDRVQNIPGLFSTSKYRNAVFQVTEKLDGVSMTVYRVEADSKWHKALPDLPVPPTAATNTSRGHQGTSSGYRIGVASAGQDLDERGNDVYWQAAKYLDLPTKINAIGLGLKNVAVQGELIGPTIKNNSLKFPDDAAHEFIIFQIFDVDKQRYVDPAKVVEICARLGLPHVPVFGYLRLRDFATSVHDILANQGQTREGFVMKSMSDEFAFKVISNKWLLEQGE